MREKCSAVKRPGVSCLRRVALLGSLILMLCGTAVYASGLEEGELAVAENDTEAGRFVIQAIVPDAKGADQVLFPVWSAANGQDDLVWYPAEQANGGWTVTLPLSKHHYESGVYNAHLYYQDGAGALHFAGAASRSLQVDVNRLKPVVAAEVTDAAAGTFKIEKPADAFS